MFVEPAQTFLKLISLNVHQIYCALARRDGTHTAPHSLLTHIAFKITMYVQVQLWRSSRQQGRCGVRMTGETLSTHSMVPTPRLQPK